MLGWQNQLACKLHIRHWMYQRMNEMNVRADCAAKTAWGSCQSHLLSSHPWSSLETEKNLSCLGNKCLSDVFSEEVIWFLPLLRSKALIQNSRSSFLPPSLFVASHLWTNIDAFVIWGLHAPCPYLSQQESTTGRPVLSQFQEIG